MFFLRREPFAQESPPRPRSFCVPQVCYAAFSFSKQEFSGVRGRPRAASRSPPHPRRVAVRLAVRSAAGRVARRKARASLAGQAAPLGAASRPRGSGRLCGAWGPRVTGVSAVVFGLPAAGAGGHLLAPHSPLGGGGPRCATRLLPLPLSSPLPRVTVLPSLAFDRSMAMVSGGPRVH